MTTRTLSLLLVFLTGCSPMTNQEIIEATKYCEENGLEAHLYENSTATSHKIVCHPRKCECCESK